MEAIVAFLKTMPSWLSTFAEVAIVILAIMLAMSLLAGFWLALCILKRRRDYIAEVSFIPFRITFHSKDEKQ